MLGTDGSGVAATTRFQACPHAKHVDRTEVPSRFTVLVPRERQLHAGQVTSSSVMGAPPFGMGMAAL